MLAQGGELLYPKRVLQKLFPEHFWGNILVTLTAMALASCGGGSGGAALPTGTGPSNIDPGYEDPKIIALERFQDGNQLVLFSSTDGTQTYLGLVQGEKLATVLGQQQGTDLAQSMAPGLPGRSCPAGSIKEVDCEAGSYGDSADWTCKLCEGGTYQPNGTQTSCEACPVGSACAAGSTPARPPASRPASCRRTSSRCRRSTRSASLRLR